MWKLLVKYPLFLSYFNKNWILSTDFRKKAEISNFIKLRPVGVKLSRADGQTDIKVTVVSRNFTNAPENVNNIQYKWKANFYLEYKVFY